MDQPTLWRKSSRSAGANNCVELAWAGAVRDSKNPTGPTLTVPLGGMLDAVKADRLHATR
jgi:hypothetical protein